MKPLRHVSTNFEQKGHRSLLIALLLMILASPLLQQHVAVGWLLAVVLMLVLLTAVRTVASSRRNFQTALVLCIFALVPQFGVLFGDFFWLDIVRYFATMLFLFWVCGLLLRDIVLRSHSVTLELLLGAINIYMMVAIGFAFAYALIERLQPGSFTGLEEFLNHPSDVLYFLYFSFVTITTLGYGDISPLTSYGMTASYLESVFGQLYLAILVARLVSMYLADPPAPAE